MSRNALQLKEQIVTIFKRRGPSLPIHISKETGLDLLFASAFLSELIGDKMVKISVMKIGSSPLYFLPGQEHLLENFIEFLNKKEREAFLLLKEKKFLKDSEQEPAIRVALRAIKDFAFEYRKNDELYWKFLRADESEFVEKKKDEIVLEPEEKSVEIIINPKAIEVHEKIDNQIIKTEERAEAKKPAKISKKSPAKKKQDDKFFNRVKEFIDGKNAEIVEIISAGTSELILKIKIGHKEKILVAYKKKNLSEKDIISAYRRAQKYELPFLVTSLGEPSKTLTELIEAVRILSDVERVK